MNDIALMPITASIMAVYVLVALLESMGLIAQHDIHLDWNLIMYGHFLFTIKTVWYYLPVLSEIYHCNRELRILVDLDCFCYWM